MSADEQIKLIADYIMLNVPGGARPDENPGRCAVRLLKEYRILIEKWYQGQEQVECADEDYAEQLSKHRAAFTEITKELGVPDESYPAPVANAYEIAKHALGE